jgi:hypothetical protein
MSSPGARRGRCSSCVHAGSSESSSFPLSCLAVLCEAFTLRGASHLVKLEDEVGSGPIQFIHHVLVLFRRH